MKMKKITITIIAVFMILLFLGRVNASEPVIITLDPGHGGKDSGAVNKSKSIREADVSLKIAKYIKSYLENYENITIYLTHDGDIASNKDLAIIDRCGFARQMKSDMFISLHINDSTSASSNGAEVYVTRNKSKYKDSTYYDESKKYGDMVLNNLKDLGLYNRGVRVRESESTGPLFLYSDGTHTDYYGVIRYCMRGTDTKAVNLSKGEGIPSILIEHCFINNVDDSKHLETDAKIKKLAEADAKAIVNYFQLKNNTLQTESNTYNSIKISWRADSKGTEYTLYYSTSKNGTYKKLTTTTDLSYIHKGVKTGTKYYYKIEKNTGLDDIGNLQTEQHGIITDGASKLNKPVSYVKKANNKAVKTYWKNTSGASGYKVYMKTTAKGSYELIKTKKDNIAPRSYTKTKLKPGTTYYFKIKAYRTVDGEKVYSTFSNVNKIKL